jgi:cytosine permease
VVLFGFTFFSATMMAGGQIGAALGFGQQLLGVVLLGNLLLATYAAALAVVAFRTGLSTVLMARFCFGERGSGLADLLLGLTQIGWYAWGTDTVAQVLIETFHWPEKVYVPLVVLTGLGFCITAAIGYKGLEVLSAVMVPLMTGLIVWSSYLAFQSVQSVEVVVSSMPVAKAITIVVGTFVSGATQSTNWTRYARSKGSAIGVTFLAFFVGNGLMVGYGALTGSVYANPDIVSVLLLQGFFASALFMLWANIWTTQDNTIYNFSLAGCHLFRTNNRRLVTFLGAGIGTVLALAGFAQLLVPFLLTLGTAIPPLGGVILAEFLVRRRGAVPDLETTQLGSFNLHGTLAYFVGVTAAWFLPGIPPVTGVVVAFLVHAAAGSASTEE